MMRYQANPAALPFLNAALISAGLAFYAWRRWKIPTAPAFAAMMAGEAAWALGVGLELLFADLPTKVGCLDLAIVGKNSVPVGLLVFVLSYTGQQKRVTGRTLVLACAFPAATILLHWADPWHHLYWSHREVAWVGGYARIEGTRGPWFWMNVGYNYALMALSVALLALSLPRMTGVYRRQVVLILFGALAPWIVNAIYQAGYSPYPGVDLTATVFSLTGLAIVPGLLRYGILDLVPVARDAVVQGMREAVLVLDRLGRIIDLNPSAQRLLGRPAAEVLGADAGRAFGAWPALAARLEGRAEGTFEVGGSGACADRCHEVSLARLVERGQAAGWVVVVRDISERKRAERERARLVEEQVARAEAEASGRAKDRFLAVLSHELRTPLTPVLMAVSALLDGDEAAGLGPTLEMIRRNVELEARLIDDLLDVTRIGGGTLRLDTRTVDAHDAVRQAVHICLGEIEQCRIALTSDLTASEHHVEADPARLQQIIWNLVKNATKFTAPGGSIAVRSRNQPPPGPGGRPRLVIEVTDDGAGIEAGALTRIFEPFEQGEVPSPRRSGLGLGLTIGRSLAEAHGGRLTAASPGPGRGSTFLLELPTVARPADAKPPPGAAPSPPPRSGGLRILLVEDNRDTRMYLALVLCGRGHEVTAAERLSEARQAAADRPFDLLISDIELPDGTGLELMRELRRRGLPGVAMSGYGSEEDVRASLGAGFAEHLTKPVDLTRLLAAVHRILAAARAGASEGVGTGVGVPIAGEKKTTNLA
jgi:PAS domain S-box-containing protein